MEPITLQAQPTTAPTFSVQTLREVLAKGQAAHPELACRMERAARIVAFRRIEAGQGGGYWVQSEGSDREYWVYLSDRGYRADRCTCPDYKERGGPCKHAMAVRLLQACERAEARRAAQEPILSPQRGYSDSDRFELTPKGEAYLAAQEPTPAG